MENMGITLQNKNILVTGGTGFAGSHLVELLLQKNANILSTVATTNPLSYFFQKKFDKQITLAAVDINNFEALHNLVTKFHVDYIFHLAAQPLVEVAYDNPKQTLYTNILGTINILESARLFPKIKGVIVASSDKAYGKLHKDKYIETDALQGDHPYEVSKSAADLIAQSYYKTYNLPITISRFGNIYGEGDLNFSRIVPGIMEAIIKNETLELRSDGTFVRDYLHVKDVANGYIHLAENIEIAKGHAFNFGSNDTLSVLELIRIIENSLKIKLPYVIRNSAKNEIPYQSLDYTKIEKMIGWKPEIQVAQSIKDIYTYYKQIL